jgi:branched-chain amino acid transport system substrate-binding protein
MNACSGNSRSRWLTGVLAIAGVLVAGSARAAAEPIRLGVITSLSGSFATFGAMEVAGYKVALAEVNARGGVLGRPVEMIVEDDASNQNAALAAAEKLIGRGTPLILGAYASSITKPLAGYLTREKVPLLNSNSADTGITKPGSPYVFRVGQTTDSFADACFEMAHTLPGLKKVAILVSNDALGKSAAKSAKDRAVAVGMTVVAEQTYDRGLTDFRPTLNAFKALSPDVVVLSSYEEDAAALMRQAKEVALDARLFTSVGATGYAIPQFITGAGDAAEFVTSASPWRPEAKYPGAQELYAHLKAALGGEPSHHAAKAYGGMIAAADAIQRAGSLDREAVRKALEQTKLTTAFGPISFGSFAGYRNQNPAPSLVIQVQDRKFVVVWPTSAASGQLRFPTPPWSKRPAVAAGR